MAIYATSTNTASVRRNTRPPIARAVMTGAAFALGLAVHAHGAAANTWVNDNASSYAPPGVSCDIAGYPTIQDAIDASSPGELINVCPGAYHENVTVNTKNLKLIATAPPAAVVVKGAANAHVFDITAAGVTLQGFTIVSDGFADGDIAVNVAIQGPTGLKLLGNVILGGRIGVNLGCVSFHSVVANNTVNGQTEGGINIDSCEARPYPGTHHNAIHHNIACSVTSTASIALGGWSDANQIHDNVATSISAFGKGNTIANNITQLPIFGQIANNTLTNNIADPGVCSASAP